MRANILRRFQGSQAEAHAARSLMARAAHGFAWVFAWRMATRLMGLGSTLILVRLLAPAEFGLVAIALSFINSIDQFSQIGVEEAVVRMPSPSQRIYDTAFTMIALRTALIALIAVSTAWPVADFFKEPRLAPIMFAIAAVTAIGGFENVGIQDLRREMRFDQEFMFQALPRLAGIVATIIAAFIWRNYWALIVGKAVTRVSRVAMSYLMHKMRPRFSLAAWRELIGFSLWTWAICVARVLRDQPSTFIIGRTLGASRVGMLSVGSEIALLPMTEIVLAMGRSMFSAFAMARRSGEDVEMIFRRLTGMTATLTLPASIGLALLAQPLVGLVLGPHWLDAVPLIQVIATGGALAVLGHACHAEFDAIGLLRQDFSVILFSAVVRMGLIAALVPWYGLMGAVMGIAASLLLETAAYLVVKWWALPYSLRALAGVVIRPLLATAGMAAIISSIYLPGTTHLPETTLSDTVPGLIVRLAISGLLGLSSYAGLLFGLWWMAGKPAGAEADLLAALRGLAKTRAIHLPGER